LLRDADLASAESRAAMLAAAKVPDDDPPRHALAAAASGWRERTLAAFQLERDAAVPKVRYAPPAASALPRNTIAGLLARATFDPLGHLALSDREVERVAAAYAPTFEVETRADYDRIGWLRWRRGSSMPQVEATEPSVYVHSAYTRYGDQLLLQLVYTVWFPERPPRGRSDPLAGKLDGVVWRVTLAPDGEPVLYDSIHACGCFHAFFPTPRARPRPAPDGEEEWAFVPQRLPRVAPDERPVVTLASGTHELEGVRVARGADSLVRYTIRPYDELRSMPRMTGGHASAFGPDGLIAGSAMRQWGRHATAFAARRHFDDADLLERRFELDL
jgi:hypothetical protein